MSLRPAFWPTLFTLPALLTMLALGVWQLERLAWKNAIIERIASRVGAPPLDITAAASAAADSEYRRVLVHGVFRHERELFLAARSLRNNVGYQVVTPLLLEGGGEVLVNRGWIPEKWRDPAAGRLPGQLQGRVAVTGILRLAQERKWMQPANAPERNVWFYYDVVAMRAAAGSGPGGPAGLDRFVLEADATANPGGSPIGGQTRLTIANDHLQYAITWFSLAAALAVIYLVYHHQLGRLRFGRRPAPRP